MSFIVASARVQIYIMSRDRPDYFRQALESVLIGIGGLADVIVSDNSISDSVQKLMASDFPNVQYIRRSPPVSALEHFRMVIEESSAEFLVMFHDDDIMMSSYVSKMVAALDENPNITAVACNAMLIRGDIKTNKSFMGCVETTRLLKDSKSFLEPYLAFSRSSNPPFPGYMYRRKYLEGLSLNEEDGGKHSDVSFLTKVLRRGPFLWLPDTLIWYRLHIGNDSRHESIGERLKWLRYLIAHDGVDRSSSCVKEFKFRYWARWLFQRSKGAILPHRVTWRERVILKFIILMGFKLAFTNGYFWRKLFKRFS